MIDPRQPPPATSIDGDATGLLGRIVGQIAKFHAVPWGASMHERDAFRAAYDSARTLTDGFHEDNRARPPGGARARTPHLVFRLILGYTTAELAAALELLNVEGAPKTLIESFEHGRATLTESRRAVLAGVAKAVTRVIGREADPLRAPLMKRRRSATCSS